MAKASGRTAAEHTANISWELDDVLRAIGRYRRAERAARREIDRNVLTARLAGSSWELIATQLGTTRQAARERYNDVE